MEDLGKMLEKNRAEDFLASVSNIIEVLSNYYDIYPESTFYGVTMKNILFAFDMLYNFAKLFDLATYYDGINKEEKEDCDCSKCDDMECERRREDFKPEEDSEKRDMYVTC